MQNRQIKKIISGLLVLLLFLSVTFFSSCKSRKKIKKTEATAIDTIFGDTLSGKCRIPFKSGKALSANIFENEFNFTYVNAKFNCELKVDEEENSFNVNVRCKKDSIIWLSISKLGIDAARALITRDTVKIVLGLTEKKYFIGDFSYINQLLQSDLDYTMIQALLFGNSAEFYPDDEKLRPGKDKENCRYILSTIRKKQAKRINEGQQMPNESYQTIWIEPQSYKISEVQFEDVLTKRKFRAQYEDFRLVDSCFAPFRLLYSISAEKKITADVFYSKIQKNEPQKFPFTIPSNYERIQIQSKD